MERLNLKGVDRLPLLSCGGAMDNPRAICGHKYESEGGVDLEKVFLCL